MPDTAAPINPIAPTAPRRVERRAAAVAEGALAMAIWASSFALVKLALPAMGPLTIGGLRYFLAFLVLLPALIIRRSPLRAISRRLWLRLFLIGLASYAIGNGAMFLALEHLEATTVSFLNNLIPIVVLGAGALWLREVPTRWQALGVLIGVGGSALFFSHGMGALDPAGLPYVLVGIFGFAAFSLLGRGVARDREVDTLTLTALPLGMGGGLLLAVALPLEGLPAPDPLAWSMVLVMTLVNTVLGYLLYNHALRKLTALEMNMILNLTPLVTALIAWALLGERLLPVQIAAVVVVIAGVSLVQVGRRPAAALPEPHPPSPCRFAYPLPPHRREGERRGGVHPENER
jgi:drug/metabolite transporter (DMT)-like permease